MICTTGPRTTSSALRYALRELGRRAGATRAQMEQWEILDDGTTVALRPAPFTKTIRFRCDRTKAERFAGLRARIASRYEWMQAPQDSTKALIPDFAVPFEDGEGGGPLFTRVAEGDVVARGDVLTATLWMLSRMEEREPLSLDEHARVLARDSVAHRSGVLERPIVDEYGLAFAQALEAVMPGWRPEARRLRVKLTHDIDRIGYPRSVRSTLALLAKYRNTPAFVRDAAALAGAGRPVYLRAIDDLARISRKRRLDSAFFFKTELRAGEHDSGYNVIRRPIRACIERLLFDGFEIGLHPGYASYESQHQLDAEVHHLRRIMSKEPIGGRQHYLRWNPQTWLRWEQAGLAYDSSVGYAEAIGFRAGTCIPYRPWSIEEDREIALLEIPLIVMDCTPFLYMRLGVTEALDRIAKLIERCRMVGGVFTLLWHNASLLEPPFPRAYEPLLDHLGEHERYYWRAERA